MPSDTEALTTALCCATASLYSVCAMRGVYIFAPETVNKVNRLLKDKPEDGRRVAVIEGAIGLL